MARVALTVQQIVVTGLTPSFTAAETDGNSFLNDGQTFLSVNNGSGASINVTIQAPAKFKGLDVTDPVVAVGAGVVKDIGPFDPGAFNQSTGVVYVDYSAVTSVTVAVRRV